MKQGFRFLIRPGTFFNQLQWSRNHWMILLSFLVLATIETQVGRNNSLYHTFAMFLQHRFGLSFDIALWLLMAAKLAFMLVGAVAVTWVVYFVGSLIGQSGSQRVLSRRLAVVFTVFLASYTLQHFVTREPALNVVCLIMYIWGFVLGYVALKEQFALSAVQTVLLGIFTVLTVSASWNISNKLFEKTVKTQMQSLASRPSTEPSKYKAGANF